MSKASRPYALSLAGHDPSGGAGLTADVKVFNTLGLQGLSVCTALTYQSEDRFDGLEWVSLPQIIRQTELLLDRYPVQVLKVGLVESWPVLEGILVWLRQKQPDLTIVWDPILKASAGFDFHSIEANRVPKAMAELVDLITPNWEEMEQLVPHHPATEGARQWSRYSAILLKGGHRADAPGVDLVLDGEAVHELLPTANTQPWPKHGSGCVLSAAIVAHKALAPALPWIQICLRAKAYIERYMASSEDLLGMHA